MAVNYNDKRFTEVETDKQQALSEIEETYSGMINSSDAYYQAQINASKQWEATQKQQQQEKTDFAIEQIEQQKDQTEKDYTKEQSGAYVDWQKESNRYGANAEAMATGGLLHSGYSESSQVSMYNTYQARVYTARQSFDRAILNYNNAIKDAQLQNSSILAEIAYNAQQQQLELSLQALQYKNQLLIEKTNKKQEVDNIYHSRYQDVLQQINTENALAEEKKQFNDSLAASQAKSSSSSSKSSSSKTSGSSNKTSTAPIRPGGTSTPTFSSYDAAASYLRSQGATKGDGGLMTKNEWLSRKSRGSGSAETSYSSYSDYLNNFVAWKLSNPD